MMINNFISPEWPAPSNIKAYCTTRKNGVSEGVYAEFNLGFHSGDNKEHVQKNREQLKKTLPLSAEPLWLKQTHSNLVIDADAYYENIDCDGCYTNKKKQACVVMTADCLPVLLCNRQGTEIAAIHAGWRGLANGIIEAGLKHFQSPAHDILVYLGPAIGPQHFEVGEEVRDIFLHHNANTEKAFQAIDNPAKEKKWLANLYELARLRLNNKGVTSIYGGDLCTFSDKTRFYSYRRDGQQTGRLASLIWIASGKQL